MRKFIFFNTVDFVFYRNAYNAYAHDDERLTA